MPIMALPADVPIRATIRMIQTAMALNCVGNSITAVALITDTVTPERTINAENKNTCRNGCVTHCSKRPATAAENKQNAEKSIMNKMTMSLNVT